MSFKLLSAILMSVDSTNRQLYDSIVFRHLASRGVSPSQSRRTRESDADRTNNSNGLKVSRHACEVFSQKLKQWRKKGNLYASRSTTMSPRNVDRIDVIAVPQY